MVRIVLAVAAVLLVTWALVLVVTDGRGAGTGRSTLAIEAVDRIGSSDQARLVTECARDVTAERRTDPAGSGLVEVTVWGTPTAGRCHPDVQLDLSDLAPGDPPTAAQSPTKIVDGATSQVVTIS